MSKRVIILGSTGSIGASALEVIANDPQLSVAALSARGNSGELAEQIRRFNPVAVASGDPEFTSAACRVYHGKDGIECMIREVEADIVLAAITGIAGLNSILTAIETGRTVALANKEALAVAGPLVRAAAARQRVMLLPVDSEHSAIFQAAQSGKPGEIKKITLTASGGPFLHKTPAQMRTASIAEALHHPTWSMGKKISIDSATMMNKALEILEACQLFAVRPAQIEVVIHPQSIVHSLVEFVDHSVVAQLGVPDMKIPIQYALTWPERRAGVAPRLDLTRAGKLEFFPVNYEQFPAVQLGYQAAEQQGTAGAVLNGANEAAVEKFLAGKIPFGRILEIVASVCRSHTPVTNPQLDAILLADLWARREVEQCLT